MDIANVESVKRNRIVVAGDSIRVAGLSILLCLSKLSDNGDAEELLSGKLDGLRDRLFIPELDIADTGGSQWNILQCGERWLTLWNDR